MINVKNLTKSYKSRQALKGISFDIKAGEFYGFLGPNGAGKTTTISILSSILNADKGTITVDGLDLSNNVSKIKQVMGIVPQEIALYNELTAYENLLFWGGLYSISASDLKTRIDELLHLFGLYDRRHDKIEGYSGGMKRRINIAAALLHRPKVLLMDEPTVGIDPQSRNLIFEVVEKLHQEGMTIIYSTHYMEEAERLCDRIAIIDEGQIVAEGSLEQLKSNSGLKEMISVRFSNLKEDQKTALKSFWNEVVELENGIQFLSDNVQNDLPKIIQKCSELHAEILHLDIQKINLESVFLGLTGKQLRD